jgi:hypothetical protein
LATTSISTLFLLGVFIGFYRLIQELALFQRENRES